MQINKEGGVHVFNDELNIVLLYSHKKVAIIQRGNVFIYRRVYDSHAPMYYMKKRCKQFPNKIMIIHDSGSCTLNIKYYYHTNKRGVIHTKTEIYSSVVVGNKEPKIPKENKRRNCKKIFD